MSIEVTFSRPKDMRPTRGTAGLRSQVGGCSTTVSAMMEASKATVNESLVKKAVG